MNNAGPAIASLIVPGLGQACQGRKWTAFFAFLFGVAFWVGTLGLFGWVWNVLAAFDAAAYRPKEPAR